MPGRKTAPRVRRAAAPAVPSKAAPQRRDRLPPVLPGPPAPRGRPAGRSADRPAERPGRTVSRETAFGVSAEDAEDGAPGVSLPEGLDALSRASAASAASMRPATSDGIGAGSGRVPSVLRISSREVRTSAHSAQTDRWARTSAERSGESSPSVKSEISSTSGCPSAPNDAEDMDVMRAHLRPSRPRCLVSLLPVGRMPPAPGSFCRRPPGIHRPDSPSVDGRPTAAAGPCRGRSGS